MVYTRSNLKSESEETVKGEFHMMYPYMTLPDDTEIVHSEMKSDGRVKVYIETPDEKDGFHHTVCWLPEFDWSDTVGYSEAEMEHWRSLILKNAPLIMEFSTKGGILNAAID